MPEVKAQDTMALASIKDVVERVDDAETALGAVETDITNLQGRTDAAERAITEAEGDITTLQGRVADAEKSVDSTIAGLALAQDVVGTVSWIASHGFYVASTDRTVNEQKTYYTLTASAIASPTGDPSSSGYYELVNGKYVLSTDTAVDGTKTYYQVTAATVTSPEGSPAENNYYELRIDEAITQYIATHLALTGEGLRVTDGSSSSMLISSSGVTIRGSRGQIVGQYGEGAVIGSEIDYHIKIVNGRLSFMKGITEIAWMTGERLYIPSVVVIDSMQAGNWLWDAKSNTRHLTLKWNEEVS